MPASDKCVRHGGKNALEAANLLKKRANPPIPNGLRRDGAENRGFLEVPNIEVQDNHTYYVGQLGMWVHNKNPNGT